MIITNPKTNLQKIVPESHYSSHQVVEIIRFYLGIGFTIDFSKGHKL